MRVIYEENIEKTDFLEIILDDKEARSLLNGGAVEEFSSGIYNDRNLNVFVRIDKFGGQDATG